MLHIIRKTIVSLGERQRRALRDQSGQSLVILAFAFLGLIAMLGLALDLGLVYIERVRIKRAVDAATLAGVVELRFEEDSFSRALEYLDLNGYITDPVYLLNTLFAGGPGMPAPSPDCGAGPQPLGCEAQNACN